MHRRRIFISHSNKDPFAEQYLREVDSALTAAGFDVLIDTKHLGPGVSWRDELYTWMGLSHGAVILVSDSVLREDSIWVPREAGILLWRRTLDPSFVVVPVCIGSVTPEHLAGPPFRDLQLQAIQGVRAQTPEAVAREVVELFAGPSVPSSPFDALADRIVELLAGVSEGVLTEAAEAIGVDLGPWAPRNVPARGLALALLQVPLGVSVDAIEVLAEHIDAARADQILAIVAPSWVDLSAARWLADFGTSPAERPALILNASTHFSATMYVQRAGCKPPKTRWPLIATTGVHGEQPAREIAAEIEQSLIQEFRLADDPFQKNARERLIALLRTRQQQRRPVFVGLRLAPEMASLLAELQQQEVVRSVTLIVLSGDEFPEAPLLERAKVQRVEPRLEPGAERKAQTDFDFARSVIRA
jgi:hypothetical protein